MPFIEIDMDKYPRRQHSAYFKAMPYPYAERLPVTVLVHHALVDGVHIAAFYQNLGE